MTDDDRKIMREEIQTDAERTSPTTAEQLAYLVDRIDKLDAKIDPIAEWMKDLDTGKKIILGFGSFAGAMIAIGAVVIWLGDYLKIHFGH